jgi:hypothetical protein
MASTYGPTYGSDGDDDDDPGVEIGGGGESYPEDTSTDEGIIIDVGGGCGGGCGGCGGCGGGCGGGEDGD